MALSVVRNLEVCVDGDLSITDHINEFPDHAVSTQLRIWRSLSNEAS